MSDVTGRISSLPGSLHKVPDGTICDDHPDRLAVSRIQGETDSFGSEMYDLCQECIDKANNYKNIGRCDYCKADHRLLHAHRDYEEGMCGPVYYICEACGDKENQRALEEQYTDNDFDDYDYDSDPDFFNEPDEPSADDIEEHEERQREKTAIRNEY